MTQSLSVKRSFDFIGSRERGNSYRMKFLFTLVLSLMIVFNAYEVPRLSFLGWGELVFVILFPVFLLFKKTNKSINIYSHYIIVFCVYSVIASFFGSIIISGSLRDIFVRMVRELFYFLLVFLIGKDLFSLSIFKKVFGKIVFVLSLFIIIQTVVFYATGYFISGLILSAKLYDGTATGLSMYESLLTYAKYSGYLKPNGFLVEPSTCADCCFIYLLVLFFDKKKTSSIWISLLVSVAMACTMSTSAFLELIVAWSMWLFFSKRKNVISVCAFVFLAFIAVFLIANNSKLYNVIYRFFSAFEGVSDVFSSGARITKGFIIFGSLPNIHKIFGIGFGAYDAAVSQGIISSDKVSTITNDYMNSASYLLVSSGIIGTFTFLLYFCKLFKTRDIAGKMFIIGLILLFFGGTVYCSPFFIILMLLILFSQKKERKYDYN